MSASETLPPLDTREMILDAAVRLLLANGIDAVSMARIATEAGVSRRTVFNQFASKEGVFAAAMQRVWTRIPMLEITSDSKALTEPTETLREIGRAIMHFWLPQEAVDTARMVIRESIRYPDLAATYINRGKRPTLEALINYMKRLKAADIVDIDDPDLAARQFVGLINEPLVFYRVLGLSEAPRLEHARYVVDQAVKVFFARYPLKIVLDDHRDSDPELHL